MYTNLAYVPPTYKRVKNYKFSLSIKTYICPYLVETEMGFSSGAGTTHTIYEPIDAPMPSL